MALLPTSDAAGSRPQSSTVGRLALADLLLSGVRAMLRIVGFPRTVRALAIVPRLGGARVAVDDRWAAEIAAVARPPLGGSCLDRAVLMWFVMRQHGLDGDIRIGVARPTAGGNGHGEAIVAHAWVEHFGVVVNDDPNVADGYAVFDGNVTELAFK